MKTRASFIALCLSLFALAGCDYTVPLAEKPELPIDKALVGAWERTTQQGEVQRLLVLPFSEHEYMVAWPAGAPNTLYARACLCKATEFALVQLAWFGTGHGTEPDNARVYQYAAYSVAGDKLTARLLNADTVSRDAATPAALLAAIKANNANPELFREELAFTRVKPPPDANAPLKRPPVPKDWQ
jgi:hypothetical protein